MLMPILGKMGDLQGALQSCTKTIQINPGHALAHNNMGYTRECMGNVSEAMACYMKALQLEPGYKDASTNLERLRVKAIICHMWNYGAQ